MATRDGSSFALNALAGLHQEANDLDAAEPLFEEALALAREQDDHESVAIRCANLARLVVERGDGFSNIARFAQRIRHAFVVIHFPDEREDLFEQALRRVIVALRR